jgi:hypothetical protein
VVIYLEYLDFLFGITSVSHTSLSAQKSGEKDCVFGAEALATQPLLPLFPGNTPCSILQQVVVGQLDEHQLAMFSCSFLFGKSWN